MINVTRMALRFAAKRTFLLALLPGGGTQGDYRADHSGGSPVASAGCGAEDLPRRGVTADWYVAVDGEQDLPWREVAIAGSVAADGDSAGHDPAGSDHREQSHQQQLAVRRG